MKKPLEILQGLRELYTDETKWTKNTFARDRLGCDIPPNREGAECFCMLGGVDYIAGSPYSSDPCADRNNGQVETITFLEHAIVDQIRYVEDDCIDVFNDDPKTTIVEVRKVIDRAIEFAEQAA